MGKQLNMLLPNSLWRISNWIWHCAWNGSNSICIWICFCGMIYRS
uniref:Uncharacterized protein n=1 Tax=Picea glauca TaxID=3330 RepID=A0A117NFZ6_PICGL|nr:hypothetical protein ABT39_MTgene2158 [Picea glauca]